MLKILVIGVFLTDSENLVTSLVSDLSKSVDFHVTQKWVAIGERVEKYDHIREYIHSHYTSLVPKFSLVNKVLSSVNINDYDYLIICDDDISLPSNFIDQYIGIVHKYGFSLCQPARSKSSFIDHIFVKQLEGLTARRTNFVEIGPLFSIYKDIYRHLLPFDELSPMGWGYDLIWPQIGHDKNFALGIVDATPVCHSIRKPTQLYSRENSILEMNKYLAINKPFTLQNAFYILNSYP